MSVKIGAADASALSSLGCGGIIRNAVFPENLEEIRYIWQNYRDFSFVFLGGCTNTLVCATKKEDLYVFSTRLKGFSVREEKLTAYCGEKTAFLSALAYQNGLAGLEDFCLLPGTVGGALLGNSGCHGREISDSLDTVEVFSRKDGLRERCREDLVFSYRQSSFAKDEFLVSATFSLRAAPKEVLQKRRREVGEIRRKALPSEKSLGSVFKKVNGVSAGYYLERLGFKGKRLGGIRFSEKHANVLINDGNGRAEEYKELVELAEEACLREYGIRLEREVRILDG